MEAQDLGRPKSWLNEIEIVVTQLLACQDSCLCPKSPGMDGWMEGVQQVRAGRVPPKCLPHFVARARTFLVGCLASWLAGWQDIWLSGGVAPDSLSPKLGWLLNCYSKQAALLLFLPHGSGVPATPIPSSQPPVLCGN